MIFIPVYKKLLVKPIEVDNKTEGGILIPDRHNKEPRQGFVVSVAPDCEHVKENDIAMFAKGTGANIKLENSETGKKEDYIILGETQILGVFREQEDEK